MANFRQKYIDFKKWEANKRVASEDFWSLIIDSSKREIYLEREKKSP